MYYGKGARTCTLSSGFVAPRHVALPSRHGHAVHIAGIANRVVCGAEAVGRGVGSVVSVSRGIALAASPCARVLLHRRDYLAWKRLRLVIPPMVILPPEVPHAVPADVFVILVLIDVQGIREKLPPQDGQDAVDYVPVLSLHLFVVLKSFFMYLPL